ncbi:MAG: hypothetical protein ACC662_01335 [Planctomycetota bacterium]
MLRLASSLCVGGFLGGLLLLVFFPDGGNLIGLPFGILLGLGVIVFVVTGFAWLASQGEAFLRRRSRNRD